MPGAHQSEMPFALVQGQPVTQLPEDLYIPPDALEVILEAFEGPLDLLLYLIRRQNLDILDIPIAEISKQYVAYVEILKDIKFDLASRKDRHTHIGEGFVGLEGFQHIINDPRFIDVPMILETPKSKDMHEDVENLAVLRGLVG